MTEKIRNAEEKYNFWQKHLEAWKQSNITQAEYCRRNGLASKSFTYWKSRITSSAARQISFVPVTVRPESVRTVEEESYLRVVLQNGLKIEVAETFNPSTLKKLIRTIEAE